MSSPAKQGLDTKIGSAQPDLSHITSSILKMCSGEGLAQKKVLNEISLSKFTVFVIRIVDNFRKKKYFKVFEATRLCVILIENTMKNHIFKFIVALLLLSTCANAQLITGQRPIKDIPLTVKEAFDMRFSGYDPVWFTHFQGRYDNQQVYEGRFLFDKRYSTAVYTPDGDLIAFVATVEYLEIPKAARDYMEMQFPGRPIIEAALVTRGGSDVTYEIGIYLEDQYVIQVFTKDGEFIRSTKG